MDRVSGSVVPVISKFTCNGKEDLVLTVFADAAITGIAATQVLCTICDALNVTVFITLVSM